MTHYSEYSLPSSLLFVPQRKSLCSVCALLVAFAVGNLKRGKKKDTILYTVRYRWNAFSNLVNNTTLSSAYTPFMHIFLTETNREMQRTTPLRNSNTCTPDFLTWPESSPPVSASGNRSRQPSDKISEVLRGRQLAEDETRSLAKRKQCSGYRMKEMIEGGIYSDNAEDTASDANSANSKNRTGIRVYQQAMSGISQIFNTEESISPKKPISIPEEAKQGELGGTLQNEPGAKSRKQMSSAKTSDLGGTSQNEAEAESRKQMSSAKTKELSGTDLFGPPTEIVPHSFTAARTLESEENKDVGEHVPRHLHTSVKVSNPAGGQSNILFGEEPVKKTPKKMQDQKLAEMTGNNIFKGDVPLGSAEKHLSTARHREMAGSDIFADGKAENRDHILGARRQMAGSDIFSDGKAENREHILGARRPPGGGSSIILD